MAASFIKSPFDGFKKPRLGPKVQNQGGLAPNTAPIATRPVSSPGVKLGPPGPAPGGPTVTPGAAAANEKFAARKSASRKDESRATGQIFGRGGGSEGDTPKGSLLEQIRSTLSGMFSGGNSKSFINRSKQALGAGIEGQRAQASKRIDSDAIRRGLFRSGIPAELQTATNNAAQGAFATGLADILGQGEQQDIQGRQFATTAGSSLLGQNRSFDEVRRSEAEAARGRGRGGPGTSTIIDPDTGESFEVNDDVFRFL